MLTLGEHRKRYAALESEAGSWRDHWRQIAEQVRPRSVRMLANDVTTQGQRKDQAVINGTPFFASRTTAAGLMGGITSPARPWFLLSTPDKEMGKSAAGKAFLEEAAKEIREAFDRSNFYNALHSVYADLADFGTSCIIMEEDEEDSLRLFHLPVGSYFLAQSERLACDTLYRRTTMTVRQLIRKFGIDAVSQVVRNHWESKRYDEAIEVVHCILPAEDAEASREANGKPWVSLWWEEKAQQGQEDRFLRVSGYEEKPFFAPRWETTGEDVYGTSPGMTALGDCRALQLLERRKAQLIEKSTNPAMTGPAALRNTPISLLPGGFTPVDAPAAGNAFRPAHEVQPGAIEKTAQEIRETEARIRQAYYADLWLMLSQSDGDMTAREVVERREEKMLQLGTVLQKLKDELLDPSVTRAFAILTRLGRMPVPPPEMQGQVVRIEFLSIMAAAQKLQGVTGVERLAVFVQTLSQSNQAALDKFDSDQAVVAYADMVGVPQALVRSDDEVEALRAQRAKAMQQQQLAAGAQQRADVAKTLADTDTAGSNALTEMMRGVGVR